jgi:ribosomal protein S18 acetylase RimI-like enzyme
MATLSLRPLLPADQDFLWDVFHIALWDPPPAPLRPRAVLDHPDVRIYAQDWGQEGDVGVVGEVGGQAVGAAWMRLIRDGKGLAYIDDGTPQLGIGLLPAFQHKGYGRQLLTGALAAAQPRYRQVALSVHPQNPAQRLYEQCGFRQVDVRHTYRIMVCRW